MTRRETVLVAVALCAAATVAALMWFRNTGRESVDAYAQTETSRISAERRAKAVDWIHKVFPAMPDAVVQDWADHGATINESTGCAVIDAVLAPGSAAPDDMVRFARASKECRLGTENLTADKVAARLDGKSFVFAVEDDTMVAMARSKSGEVQICCTFQELLTRISGSDYWVIRKRISSPRAAVISLFAIADDIPQTDFGKRTVWRGPEAPNLPSEKAMASLRGKVLTPTLKSAALGETRKLAVYLPPGWSKAKQWPTLFLADGGAAQYAPMVEAMIDAGEIAPIVMVSAETGLEAIVGKPPEGFEDLRASEYVRSIPGPGNDQRFAGHMTFFAEEMTRYAVDEYSVSPERTQRAVAGSSNGGVFAAWAGLQHPEAYGTSIAMSPGILEINEADLKKEPRARFFFSGGDYEGGFQAAAKYAEERLRKAGYQAEGRYLATGHDPAQWAIVLHDALPSVFPPS
jgi:enterochelin esterase-like enzyme